MVRSGYEVGKKCLRTSSLPSNEMRKSKLLWKLPKFDGYTLKCLRNCGCGGVYIYSSFAFEPSLLV